jgi:hypothetical protein
MGGHDAVLGDSTVGLGLVKASHHVITHAELGGGRVLVAARYVVGNAHDNATHVAAHNVGMTTGRKLNRIRESTEDADITGSQGAALYTDE